MPHADLSPFLPLLLIWFLQDAGEYVLEKLIMVVLTLISFPITAVLTVAFLTFFFGAFAVPPVLGIEWLYRKAILRWMNRPGGSARTPEARPYGATPPDETTTQTRAPSPLQFEVHDPDKSHGSNACPLNRRAKEASQAVTLVYVAAGVVYAAAMTPLAGEVFRLARDPNGAAVPFDPVASYLITFATLLWLPVLVYLVAAVAQRTLKLMVLAAYLFLYTIACVFLPTQYSVYVWTLLAAAPTSMLLVLRFSGIGGLALGAILSFVTMTFTVVAWAVLPSNGAPAANAQTGQALSCWLGLLITAAPFAGVAVALALLWWTSHRYVRKQTSEQILLMDGFWLSTTFMLSVTSATTAGLYATLGVLPFFAYKLVVWAGLRRLGRAPREGRELRLLLLRVFGAKRSSEWLLKRLGHYWRYVGSIQLIAAPDLASANLELDELLDFIRLRLKSRFVKDEEDCERRVRSLDVHPDPDGRYRVNEFFCHDDVWRKTVAALTERSDAVLMDLRGFTSKNVGCAYELYHLVDAVAVDRLVIIVNDKTDHVFLRRTFEDAWASMGAGSPNRRLASPVLRLLHIRRQNARAVSRLLSLLGEAAEHAAASHSQARAPIASRVAAESRA